MLAVFALWTAIDYVLFCIRYDYSSNPAYNTIANAHSMYTLLTTETTMINEL